MKEATGELNMTVVTVVAIAAVMAFFYAFVWPSIKTSITRSTNCSNAYGCTCNGKTCSCLYDTESSSRISIQCDNSNS